MTKAHIVMLLSNAFRPDPRVLKEAESLAQLGYQITVICWDRAAEMQPQETLSPGITIRRIQNIRSIYGVGARQLLHLPRFWRAALPLLDELQPDLIHCHDFDTLPAGLFWGKTHHRPVVYDAHEYYADLCKPRLHGWHGWLLYQLIRLAEQWLARLASAVITVDELLGALYRKIHNHVVIVGHYPSRSLVSMPAPVFTRSTLTLLYLGRLSLDRGLLIYADLLRGLLEQGIPARLKLAGVFTSPGDEEMLRERCRGMEDALEVVGWVHYHQLAALFAQTDVGLSILLPEPRYVAALPVKLFEYMAAGLPVVASNFPSIATIFADAHCGALVDPLEPQTTIQILSSWWQNPIEARQLGANGRQAILQTYNWESLAQQIDHLYQSLLKEKPG